MRTEMILLDSCPGSQPGQKLTAFRTEREEIVGVDWSTFRLYEPGLGVDGYLRWTEVYRLGVERRAAKILFPWCSGKAAVELLREQQHTCTTEGFEHIFDSVPMPAEEEVSEEELAELNRLGFPCTRRRPTENPF